KRQPGIGMGRDPERTPMPWDGSLSSGFSTGRPWLPIGDANQALNVQSSRNDPGSILSFYRHLLRMRRAEPVLVLGGLTDLTAYDGVIQFLRSDTGKRVAVMMNLSEQARTVAVKLGSIIACTDLRREGESVADAVELAPSEALMIELLP
ncbi:MAG TPA: DUF3459 domain-containing protein, partial [Acidobacteriaceae bacterium]|nr:DUF3459 domain-containing protein [Acidobacteriaceae bacterium]